MDTNGLQCASPPGRQSPEEFYMVIMKSECRSVNGSGGSAVVMRCAAANDVMWKLVAHVAVALSARRLSLFHEAEQHHAEARNQGEDLCEKTRK